MNIKLTMTFSFDWKYSKSWWLRPRQNVIAIYWDWQTVTNMKHVKRKKDHFPASHRMVAEIAGEPKIWPLYGKFLGGIIVFRKFLGGIIVQQIFPIELLPSHSQCESGWTVVSFLLFLCKLAELWKKQKWKLQALNAKVFVCGFHQLHAHHRKVQLRKFHTIIWSFKISTVWMWNLSFKLENAVSTSTKE